VNYERVVWQQAKHTLSARAGFFVLPGRTDTNSGAFPAQRTTA